MCALGKDQRWKRSGRGGDRGAFICVGNEGHMEISVHPMLSSRLTRALVHRETHEQNPRHPSTSSQFHVTSQSRTESKLGTSTAESRYDGIAGEQVGSGRQVEHEITRLRRKTHEMEASHGKSESTTGIKARRKPQWCSLLEPGTPCPPVIV